MMQTYQTNQFQRKLGCFFGLSDGFLRQKEALQIQDPTKFINFIHSDSLFSIKKNVDIQFDEFNKGISRAYNDLYKIFRKVENQQNLSELFHESMIKIGNFKYYFLKKFYELKIESNTELDINPILNDSIELIQNIRKKIPYFMGLIASFLIFKNETKYINEIDLPEILKKLKDLQDNYFIFNAFWIGFIEMLLKLQAHFVYYGDNLDDYKERMIKIEKKSVKMARNYRLNYEIFSIIEIFN